MVTSGWAQTVDTRQVGTKKADDWNSWDTTLLSPHQPNRGRPHTACRPPLRFCLKLYPETHQGFQSLHPKHKPPFSLHESESCSAISFFKPPRLYSPWNHAHDPAVNTSLLQSPALWFLWPHCALGTEDGAWLQDDPKRLQTWGPVESPGWVCVTHILLPLSVFLVFCLRCPSHQGLENEFITTFWWWWVKCQSRI